MKEAAFPKIVMFVLIGLVSTFYVGQVFAEEVDQEAIYCRYLSRVRQELNEKLIDLQAEMQQLGLRLAFTFNPLSRAVLLLEWESLQFRINEFGRLVADAEGEWKASGCFAVPQPNDAIANIGRGGGAGLGRGAPNMQGD